MRIWPKSLLPAISDTSNERLSKTSAVMIMMSLPGVDFSWKSPLKLVKDAAAAFCSDTCAPFTGLPEALLTTKPLTVAV